MPVKTIDADQVFKALATKHANDVFVGECKNGPTHGANHVRLDAWAMPRSWTRWKTIGYEVKVSRSDFLRDDKWPAYLTMCHELYFVCPHGLIQPDELPAEVGLMWLSKTGTRIYTKKKAPHRSIEFPQDVFVYLLMTRTEITREHALTRAERIERMRDRLETARNGKLLGALLNDKIRETLEDAEERARAAERQAEALAGYAEVVDQVIPDWRERRWGCPSSDKFRARLLEATGTGDDSIVRKVEGLIHQLKYVKSVAEGIQETATAAESASVE